MSVFWQSRMLAPVEGRPPQYFWKCLTPRGDSFCLIEMLSFRTEDPVAEEQKPSALKTRTNLTSAIVREHVGLVLNRWSSLYTPVPLCFSTTETNFRPKSLIFCCLCVLKAACCSMTKALIQTSMPLTYSGRTPQERRAAGMLRDRLTSPDK